MTDEEENTEEESTPTHGDELLRFISDYLNDEDNDKDDD